MFRAVGDGEAVRQLGRVAHRYVAGIRLFTMVPTVIIASVVAWSTASAPATVGALLVLAAWSLAYCWLLTHRRGQWVTAVDAAVLAGLALISAEIVPLSWLASGKSWLLPFLAFACVGYQYYAGWLLGGGAAAVVLSAMIVGTSEAVPAGGSFDSVHTAIWSIVLVLLARMLWLLVEQGGRKADVALAEAARAGRDQMLAQGIRAESLAHNRRLHDTAASTLLMVGLGQAHRDRDLLAAQARRDVEALTERWEAGPSEVDLVAAIADVISLVPLAVQYSHPRRLPVPGTIAGALAGATQEALVNIHRHAGVAACVVDLTGDSTHVVVEVIDTGVGFDQRKPNLGRGVRESIHGRMAAVAGRATTTSAFRQGTTVLLEWAP